MKLSSRLATEEKKQFGDVVEQDNGNNATLDRNGGRKCKALSTK
jgi:hypothetical protein